MPCPLIQRPESSSGSSFAIRARGKSSTPGNSLPTKKRSTTILPMAMNRITKLSSKYSPREKRRSDRFLCARKSERRCPFMGNARIFRKLALLLLAASALAAAAAYRVIKRIPIPGDYGWDYVTADSEARRLYVPHGIEVVVLDLDSGAIAGKIAVGKGVHGVAIARELGRGFISATDPGSVTIFDRKTLAIIDKIRVGDDPNGIIYDPSTKRVFSADRGSQRLTAIDAATGKIAGAATNLA